jgi:hypothetical protein
MAKFYGIIGIADTTETAPGVWSDGVSEIAYTGDVIRKTRRIESGDKVNPDVSLSDSISIIADEFTLAKMHLMKYVKWRGAVWAINSFTVAYPRIQLEIGGLYNGPTA